MLEYVGNPSSDQLAGGVEQKGLIPRVGKCLICRSPNFSGLSMTIPPPQDVGATYEALLPRSPPTRCGDLPASWCIEAEEVVPQLMRGRGQRRGGCGRGARRGQ